jgi:KDO transferase-3
MRQLLPARPITRLRKALYRLGVPQNLSHMRKLHPDFRLEPSGREPGQLDVLWKRKPVARVRPASGLAGRESGGDCFVIATGPSVADLDLRRLTDRTCIGVNGSILKAAESDLTLDYYVVTDRTFANDRFELLRQALRSPARCVFSFRVLSEICEREPALLEREDVYLLPELNFVYGEPKRSPEAFDAWADRQPDLLLHPEARRMAGRVGFSKSLEKGVFTGQTVVFCALQLAHAIGFGRVFILGMDLGGPQADYRRFYEAEGLTSRTRLGEDFEPIIRPSFELVGRVRDEDGFEVYNLSPESRLAGAVVPKLGYEEALGLQRGATAPGA